jgi:hypothetical protein
MARVVDMASRHTIAPHTCLHRSLGGWWLLRRRGIRADLRFGVRKGPDGLHGHAWVEYAGQVLNDGPEVPGGYVDLPWVSAGRDA